MTTNNPLDSASQIKALMSAPDRRAAIEQVTADPADEAATRSGMVMLGLAFLASRDLARMANQTGALVVGVANNEHGGQVPTQDPRALATLLLAAVANDDRELAFTLAQHALQQGRQASADTIEVLAAMVADVLDSAPLVAQNPQEN